ncbi:tetratricopeptide repeat protein [Emcibacter sp. SYSU 3D8]|uniref:tetratricopeptide repeat protein n=1 Tax=Emcibacter sp. SYSU 3D8 TaxID=3133969 RepID=UPI0031FEF605
MNEHSVIFSELDPDLRRARTTLRVLGTLAAGAAIAAVCIASSSPLFAATPAGASLCREYFQAENYDKARMHCAAAAEDEDSGSRAALGWMYLHGKGVPANKSEAARLIKASAEQGNIAASAVLGGMYLNGVAVQQDTEQARKWIVKAAEGGHEGAQVTLGNLYIGERPDSGSDNSVRLAKATAGSAAGSSGATDVILAEPRSESMAAAAPDPKAAVKWYKKAAKNGSAAGQAALGEAYRLGLGVEQNEVAAYMWYTLAAEQGFHAAADAREIVAAQMMPKQIAKAQEKARDWSDSHTRREDRAPMARR